MPVHNDCTKVAFQELEAVGLKGRLVDRGKHQALVWDIGKNGSVQQRSLIIAVSPSDWRAPMATRSEIRKMLKEDNFLPANKEEERELAWRENIEKQFGRFMARLEQKENENKELIQKLKKLENDIEGVIATMGELPAPTPPPNPALVDLMRSPAPWERSDTTPAPGTGPKLVIVPPTLSPPTPLIIPPVPQARGRKPNEFWETIEAQMANNTRLPARKGYRVVPEHYEKIVEVESESGGEVMASPKPSAAIAKGRAKKVYKLRKDGTARKRYTLSTRGIEALKKNAARARETLAKKRAEKGLA